MLQTAVNKLYVRLLRQKSRVVYLHNELGLVRFLQLSSIVRCTTLFGNGVPVP
jgi:hypothetical protein